MFLQISKNNKSGNASFFEVHRGHPPSGRQESRPRSLLVAWGTFSRVERGVLGYLGGRRGLLKTFHGSHRAKGS